MLYRMHIMYVKFVFLFVNKLTKSSQCHKVASKLQIRYVFKLSWAYIRIWVQETYGPKHPLVGPYCWTQDLTQVPGLVSHVRRVFPWFETAKFWQNKDDATWNATSYSPTVNLDTNVNSLGPKLILSTNRIACFRVFFCLGPLCKPTLVYKARTAKSLMSSHMQFPWQVACAMCHVIIWSQMWGQWDGMTQDSRNCNEWGNTYTSLNGWCCYDVTRSKFHSSFIK
jgi:hypothetical protein